MSSDSSGLFTNHYTETHYGEDGDAVTSTHASTVGLPLHGWALWAGHTAGAQRGPGDPHYLRKETFLSNTTENVELPLVSGALLAPLVFAFQRLGSLFDCFALNVLSMHH